jgi:Immunity protein 52
MINNDILMYWGCRPLNLMDRALLVYQYLNSLQSILLDKEWDLPTKKIITLETKDGLKAILDDIKNEVEKHHNITKVEDSFVEDVSSIVSVSNKFLTIRASIGGCTSYPNSIVIERRYKSQVIYDQNIMKDIFIKSIEYFNPDWGAITDSKFTFEIADQSIKEYWFGWMSYFSNGIALPLMPRDFKNENVGSLGKLYITTDEIFDAANPLHVEKAKILVELFRKEKIVRA